MEYVKCRECGASIAENWIVRHKKSGCKVGFSNRKKRKYRYRTWDERPLDGTVIRVWNQVIQEWEDMEYVDDNGGTIKSLEDPWEGTVKRFGRFLYPKWAEK